MATVDGMTAERMLEIEAASVVDGDVVGDDLVLSRHDGSTINAGNVRGPVGPAGAASDSYFRISDYDGVGDGVADDTAALHDAVLAAVAAGGGVVDLRMATNPNPTYLLTNELVIPTKVDLIGSGGNFVGTSGEVIKLEGLTARLTFEGVGGVSGGFTVNGDNDGHPDGILRMSPNAPVVVGRTFKQIAVINGVGDGWVVNSAQNNAFVQCHGINNAGNNWILDKGAGGNKFDRCGGSGHGEYGLVIRQTAGGVSPYPTAPSHNQFDHCIWECQNANVTGVVLITASGANTFYTCGFAGNVTGAISGGSVIDVDGSAGALSVVFDSPLITGKNGATYHGIRTEGFAQVVLSGLRQFYFFGDAHHSDSNLSTFQDLGLASYSGVTKEWGQGAAGDLTSVFLPRDTPLAFQMPAEFTTAFSIKQEGDVGVRRYDNSLGEIVFCGDGSGFANHGKIGYSVTDDGLHFTGGPSRFGLGLARTIVRQTGVSGAVTIDAKTTSHAVLELVGNVTSVTVNNLQSGQQLRITFRQDATGGRTVTHGALFKHNGNAAPGLTTANTENTVDYYYDSVNSKLKEVSRAVGVPIS